MVWGVRGKVGVGHVDGGFIFSQSLKRVKVLSGGVLSLLRMGVR
jgi:hypothetical protein